MWQRIRCDRVGVLFSDKFKSHSIIRTFANEEIQFPSDAQVVICGGGVMGTAVAYHLAAAGWGPQTVLIESSRSVGYIWKLNSFGATNPLFFFSVGGNNKWNSSGLIGTYKPSMAQVKLAQDSIALYKDLEKRGLTTGWKQCGSLSLARTSDRLISFKRLAAQSVYALSTTIQSVH